VIFFAVLLTKSTDPQYTQLLAFGKTLCRSLFRFVRVGVAKRQQCSFGVLCNHVLYTLTDRYISRLLWPLEQRWRKLKWNKDAWNIFSVCCVIVIFTAAAAAFLYVACSYVTTEHHSNSLH
jgi:hypothetical protein